MKCSRTIAVCLYGLGAALLCSQAADAAPISRQISRSGTLKIQQAPQGVDSGVQSPEFEPGMVSMTAADGPTPSGPTAGASARATRRSIASGVGVGQEVGQASAVEEGANSGPLLLSFDGVDHRDSRLASSGNQFSVEPPDQGLCVGNGFVLETVNNALRVFDTKGNPLTAPIATNAFYGYAFAIDRVHHVFGPSVFDVSCYFDSDTQRWFHLAATLDTDPATGNLTGTSHLDLAVSVSSDPTGAWNIYQTPDQDDGTQGTPSHPNCPCFGDYPHMGADANGIYLTTNEFPLTTGFNGSQIYALSKRALARGDSSVRMLQFDTSQYLFESNPGFTVWPAESPAGQYETHHGGTEYFINSLAVFNNNNTDQRLRVWALTHTKSLDGDDADLDLSFGIVPVASYGVPPSSAQKRGHTPLRDCINDTSIVTPAGVGCWTLLFAKEPAHTEVESRIDSNDSRIQQVVLANGRLFAALDTILTMEGSPHSGAAYYILAPSVSEDGVQAQLVRQGTVAVPHNNVSYPAIAALPNGMAAMAFTLVGHEHFPTAAYVTISEATGASSVFIAAAGVGPDDGFSGYAAYGGQRTDVLGQQYGRWGDYGAAVADGNTIWIASEYIAQSCTFSQWLTAPIGSCGGTRTTLANWTTRISQVAP